MFFFGINQLIVHCIICEAVNNNLFFQHCSDKMAKYWLMNSIFITFVIIILELHQVNAVCCPGPHAISHSCAGIPREEEGFWFWSECISKICLDGHPVYGSHCSVGPCNIFGCDCEYGCTDPKFSLEDAQRFFAERYNTMLY